MDASPVKTCCVICFALAAALWCGACGRAVAPGQTNQPPSANTAIAGGAAAPNNAGHTAGADALAQLSAEVERLEKQAQRNPSDDAVRDALAQAYVRRGDARRAAQQLREALRDYENALRVNPDNEEAQRNVAEISPQVEGGVPTGENGEPAPLPITPNVTGGGDETTPTPAAQQPAPAKKKRTEKP